VRLSINSSPPARDLLAMLAKWWAKFRALKTRRPAVSQGRGAASVGGGGGGAAKGVPLSEEEDDEDDEEELGEDGYSKERRTSEPEWKGRLRGGETSP
jgi:hypothetical protein